MDKNLVGEMRKKILLVGGGGHCHSVLDSICSGILYDIVGVVARDETNYSELSQDALTAAYLVGIDADLPDLFINGWHDAFVALGSVGNTAGRRKIYSVLAGIGFNIPIIKDKSAVVSGSSFINKGAYIGKNAVVNAGCRVGCCSIINTGSIIEHDCVIGDFAHISPGTVLCGEVSVGDNSHVGAGTMVKQQVVIGNDALIGMGSVVVKDIPDKVKAYGNPCRVVEE